MSRAKTEELKMGQNGGFHRGTRPRPLPSTWKSNGCIWDRQDSNLGGLGVQGELNSVPGVGLF